MMKISKNISGVALVALIILLSTFLRIALPAIPYDWGLFLVLRFLLNGGFTGPDYWYVWDIFTAVIGICCIFAVPVEGNYRLVRKFLLRPMTLVLVFILSTPYVDATVEASHAAYDEYQDRQYQAKEEAHAKEIQEFIQIADEAYAYSNAEYQGENYKIAFPELVMENRYVTNTLMIDYDTMTLGFCFYDITMFELKTFALEPGGIVPENCEWSHTLDLEGSGGKLTMYFEYRDGMVGNGSTATCIALTMPDGTVYTAKDLTNPDTGYNYFVGHIDGGYYVRIDGFNE